jgi:hypothetical protein
MKQTFELTITNQKRVIASLFSLPLILITAIIITSESNFIFGILSVVFFLFMIWYFVIGNLTVLIENETIYFHWRKKIIFNYRHIKSLKECDIEKVIIDNEQFLRKIIAPNRIINLSTSKINPKDSYRLISYFNQKSQTENIVIKNSWGNISQKWLKTFYIVNWIVIVTVILIIVFVIFFKGFKPKMLLILTMIPILIIYGKQIKDTIDKNNSNSN